MSSTPRVGAGPAGQLCLDLGLQVLGLPQQVTSPAVLCPRQRVTEVLEGAIEFRQRRPAGLLRPPSEPALAPIAPPVTKGQRPLKEFQRLDVRPQDEDHGRDSHLPGEPDQVTQLRAAGPAAELRLQLRQRLREFAHLFAELVVAGTRRRLTLGAPVTAGSLVAAALAVAHTHWWGLPAQATHGLGRPKPF